MKKIAVTILATTFLAACSSIEMPVAKNIVKNNVVKEELKKIFSHNDLVGREFIVETETYKSKKITIGFTKDRVYGFGGVNRYFGVYKIVDNKLVFENFGSTRMAGKREDELAELAFLTALQDNKEIKLEEPYLILNSNEDFNFKFKDINYKEEIVEVKKK